MISRITILIFCVVAQTSFAQNADSVLTFKRAVEIALQNNATLNTQRNNLTQNQSNKAYRIGQLGPQASINGYAGQRSGNSFIPQLGEVVNNTFYQANASLGVQMPIFNGFSGLYTAKQASTQLDAQLQQVKRSGQDVINLVSVQFLQVLLDQELLKIAQENLVLQQKQFEQVKAQVELGSRSPVDEYNQQAQLSNGELRVTQADYALVNDKITLFQTLLVDPTLNFAIQEPSWDVNGIALDNLNLSQLLEIAAENRADLKVVKYTEKANKYAMHSTLGNYLPSLSAQYNYGSAFNQAKGAPRDSTYVNFSDQFRRNNRYNSFGINLTIPLFSGFRSRAVYVQSKVTYENSKLLTKNREVLINGDVLRAYENFQSVQKAYSAGLTGLEASQMAYNLEQERYNLGITSFVDFANANKTYIQAQVDMAQAKYRFLFQKIMLDYAVGTLKVEDIP
jgi:outer membrane protein